MENTLNTHYIVAVHKNGIFISIQNEKTATKKQIKFVFFAAGAARKTIVNVRNSKMRKMIIFV